jgi:hypothetical protein
MILMLLRRHLLICITTTTTITSAAAASAATMLCYACDALLSQEWSQSLCARAYCTFGAERCYHLLKQNSKPLLNIMTKDEYDNNHVLAGPVCFRPGPGGRPPQRHQRQRPQRGCCAACVSRTICCGAPPPPPLLPAVSVDGGVNENKNKIWPTGHSLTSLMQLLCVWPLVGGCHYRNGDLIFAPFSCCILTRSQAYSLFIIKTYEAHHGIYISTLFTPAYLCCT